MKDDSVKASPKKQAKSYSYNLKNILNEKYNINPLVLDLVCYPFISKANYDKLGLSVVSEPEFTLFSEDIESTRNFASMILGVHNGFSMTNHDEMVGNVYDVPRHHFERLFTAYLERENINYPIFQWFAHPNIYYFYKKFALVIAYKLYEKGCDIKTLDMSSWGTAPAEIPHLNKIIEEVVVETENEYSRFLINNNSVALSEYMPPLSKCINSADFNTNLYKFISLILSIPTTSILLSTFVLYSVRLQRRRQQYLLTALTNFMVLLWERHGRSTIFKDTRQTRIILTLSNNIADRRIACGRLRLFVFRLSPSQSQKRSSPRTILSAR